MLQNGFEHRQYSGYVSKEAMKDGDITILAVKIRNQLSWLHSCTKKIDVTDVSSIYDMRDMIADDADILPPRQQVYSKDTLDKQNALKQKVAEFAKANNKESPSKDIER